MFLKAQKFNFSHAITLKKVWTKHIRVILSLFRIHSFVADLQNHCNSND